MFKFLKQLFRKRGSNAASRNATPAAPRPSGILRNTDAAPGVECASLSLRAILDRLPADLKSNLNQMPETDVKVILPINAIMKQLPNGSVKMSLGSLFRQAPTGTFRKTNLEDKRMVEVPLGEVFKSINPGKLHRRADQRQYVLPEDIAGLFGKDGRNHSVTPASEAPEAPKPANGEAPKPLRMPGVSTPPASEVKTNGQAAEPAPSGKREPIKLDGELSLSIVELAAGWPEGIRGELSILTGDAKIVLSVAEIGPMLQKGKVAFTWAQLRGWIVPAAPGSITIPDDTVLTLPLKVVAPAFVAATGAKKRQSAQATVGQQLPDFFGPSAGRQPAPAAPAAPAAAPTPVTPAPAPVAEAPAPVATPAAQATPAPVVSSSSAEPVTLRELFNLPDKTDWTPNELVKLTCGLPNVLGAVVALEEGLVVSQKLPEGLSADTFAAFMPQIFSRLDKYTGEMQLGENTEVTIGTEGGPVRIFRRGKLYFATLGRTGQPLPGGLQLVATELASQNA